MTCARLLLRLALALLWLAEACHSAQAGPDGIGGRPWNSPVPQRPSPRSPPLDTGQDRSDTDEERPPALRLRLIEDGRPAAEPAQPIDGIVTEPDDRMETGGAERDARSRADIDAFERPRAGFDPDAFSIEPEPALDRRPERRFRRDPFDPIGIRVGSFMIFPEAELAAAA